MYVFLLLLDVTIQDEEVQQTAQRGSQHTFHCSTRARFAPPVAWYVSGEEINSTTAASMYGMQLSSASLFNSTSGSLTVRNVEYQSPDRYVCIVAGNDTTVMIRRRFHLSVHGKFSIASIPHHLSDCLRVGMSIFFVSICPCTDLAGSCSQCENCKI